MARLALLIMTLLIAGQFGTISPLFGADALMPQLSVEELASILDIESEKITLPRPDRVGVHSIQIWLYQAGQERRLLAELDRGTDEMPQGPSSILIAVRRLAADKKIEIYARMEEEDGSAMCVTKRFDDAFGLPDMEGLRPSRPFSRGRIVLEAWGNGKTATSEYDESINRKMIYMEVH